MENYNVIEMNGMTFSVTYKYEKNIVWAITYLNGMELRKYGDSQQRAFVALKDYLHIQLNFRL